MLSGTEAPKTPYFMRGTDQYKRVSNKPFGDGTARLALEWGSRGRARALPVAEEARTQVQ